MTEAKQTYAGRSRDNQCERIAEDNQVYELDNDEEHVDTEQYSKHRTDSQFYASCEDPHDENIYVNTLERGK